MEIANDDISQILDELILEYGADNPALLEFIQTLGEEPDKTPAMSHTPVDYETFLVDPYFMGSVFPNIWPKAKESLLDIFEKQPNELVLSGATSRAKTTRSTIVTARTLYELSCYENPQEALGLTSNTELVIAMLNANAGMARDVTYGQFRLLIEQVPYFKEHFMFNKRLESKMKFPNNVSVIYGASNARTLLGKAIVGGIIDEISFFDVIAQSARAKDGGQFDQAFEIYHEIMTRVKGRFLGKQNVITSAVCVVSSRSYKDDFIGRRIAEVEEDLKLPRTDVRRLEAEKVYVDTGSQWEMQPAVNADGSIRRSGETFKFAIANAQLDCEVLEGGVKALGREVIEIPIEYKTAFMRNPIKSLNDIAGRVIENTGSFIPIQVVTRAQIQFDVEMYPRIFNTDLWDITTRGMPPMNRKYKLYNPSVPRFVHIDLAVTGDTLGFAIGHSPEDILLGEKVVPIHQKEKPLNLIVDDAIGIPPPEGGAIDFEMVRRLLYHLKFKMRIPIKWVSLDGFQCISGKTDVITHRGIIKAESLRKGDAVQSRIGARKVTKVWSFGKREGVWITVSNGSKIFVTEKHKLEALKIDPVGGVNNGNAKWEWIKAKDLFVGQKIHMQSFKSDVPSPPKYSVEKPFTEKQYTQKNGKLSKWRELDVQHMEFLGVLYADGHVCGDGVRVTTNLDELEDTITVFHKVFNEKDVKVSIESSKGHSAVVAVSSRDFVRWLLANGLDKKEDSLPPLIIKNSWEMQTAFIRGLISADGTVTKRDGAISLTSIKKNLITYIKHFMNMVYGVKGALSTVDLQRQVLLGKCHPTTTECIYILKFSGNRKHVYDSLGGLVYKRKNDLASSFLHVKGRDLAPRITEIKNGAEEVFDFEVEEDHSYMANGFVSHNSTDFMQMINKRGFETKRISTEGEVPYTSLKQAFLEDRVILVNNMELADELTGLVQDQKTKRVDHTAVSTNDIADCVAGIYMNILKKHDTGELYKEDRKLLTGLFRTVV